jgi:hypothetical protein
MCKFCDGTHVVIGLYVQEYGDVYEENTQFRTAKIVFLASGHTDKFISHVLITRLSNFWYWVILKPACKWVNALSLPSILLHGITEHGTIKYTVHYIYYINFSACGGVFMVYLVSVSSLLSIVYFSLNVLKAQSFSWSLFVL